MPAEERTSRLGERCSQHLASAAVATCDGCGRNLCLACAIPVRGQTLGAECLAEVLGPEVPLPKVPGRERVVPRLAAGGAFAVAVLASLLPWSRVGAGSGAFGAWTPPLRWAALSAVAAVVGLVLPWVGRRLASRVLDAVSMVAGALVAAGALLAIWLPPDFSGPGLGPWIALASGVVAAAGSAAALRGSREPERARS